MNHHLDGLRAHLHINRVIHMLQVINMGDQLLQFQPAAVDQVHGPLMGIRVDHGTDYAQLLLIHVKQRKGHGGIYSRY